MRPRGCTLRFLVHGECDTCHRDGFHHLCMRSSKQASRLFWPLNPLLSTTKQLVVVNHNQLETQFQSAEKHITVRQKLPTRASRLESMARRPPIGQQLRNVFFYFYFGAKFESRLVTCARISSHCCGTVRQKPTSRASRLESMARRSPIGQLLRGCSLLLLLVWFEAWISLGDVRV